MPQFFLAESPTTEPPVPEAVLARARALVKEYASAFWFRHPEAKIESASDVRLVIEHLREYGGHKAWRAAQQLHQCQ